MERKQSNFVNENINPCIKEGNLSMKCLDDALYDYSKCVPYFENYKQCKRFWRYISIQRRQLGIFPALPEKKEREKIMALRKNGVHVISAETNGEI